MSGFMYFLYLYYVSGADKKTNIDSGLRGGGSKYLSAKKMQFFCLEKIENFINFLEYKISRLSLWGFLVKLII